MTKKIKIYIIVMIVAFVLVIFGASYAYFAGALSNDANSDVNVNTENVNKIVFNEGDPINIVANFENFNIDTGSLSGSTNPYVVLNGKTDEVLTYDAKFNITSNTFVYTTNDSKPELILKVTDPSGSPITSITGLNYVSVVDVQNGAAIQGFDITTKTGEILIKDNQSITGKGYETAVNQSWEFEVIFVNLDSDQTLNEGKNFVGQFSIGTN